MLSVRPNMYSAPQSLCLTLRHPIPTMCIIPSRYTTKKLIGACSAPRLSAMAVGLKRKDRLQEKYIFCTYILVAISHRLSTCYVHLVFLYCNVRILGAEGLQI